MPSFRPFAGLRYAPGLVTTDSVVCPPYDVVSEADRRVLEEASVYNAIRVELPRDGAVERDRYEQARSLFETWRDEGVLVRDPAPAFYGHRMLFRDGAGNPASSTGVLGALGLEAPGAGILPHEQTMPKPKGDRLHLLRATGVNVSPIWGLSPASGLTELCRAPGRPAVHCVDETGVTHQLWPITDPEAVAAISDAVASAPVIIADGHHRFETALAYQAERRAGGHDVPGDYDAVLALVVELADEQLTVQGIHRLIAGLPEGLDLPGVLAEHFELRPTTPVDPGIGQRMLDGGGLGLVTPAGCWVAVPRPATLAAAERPDLDSSILEVALRRLPAHELTYQHGWELAAAAVKAGEAQAAVLIRPATVAQIAAIGRGGQRMPAKTTFFWPKPRTGLVFREVIG